MTANDGVFEIVSGLETFFSIVERRMGAGVALASDSDFHST
jgi:hypothetical protein